MASLGVGEILLLAGIALVVIGPDKFPEFAKIVLRTLRDLKGYVNEVKQDITAELRPVEREITKLSRYEPEAYIDALMRGEEEESPSATEQANSSPNAQPPSSGSEDHATRDQRHELSPGDDLD